MALPQPTGLSVGSDHRYVPPQHGDLRGPCPFLNMMANYGYLPHSGKKVSFDDIQSDMVNIMAIPDPLASILRNSSQAQVAQLMGVSYEEALDFDLNVFNGQGPQAVVDLSLFFYDETPTRPLQVTPPQRTLVDELIDLASRNYTDIINYDTMIQFRQERYEYELTQHIPSTGAANITGVMANCVLLLEVMGRNGTISVDDVRDFALNQRFPEYWKPGNPQAVGQAFQTAMSNGYCNWMPPGSQAHA